MPVPPASMRFARGWGMFRHGEAPVCSLRLPPAVLPPVIEEGGSSWARLLYLSLRLPKSRLLSRFLQIPGEKNGRSEGACWGAFGQQKARKCYHTVYITERHNYTPSPAILGAGTANATGCHEIKSPRHALAAEVGEQAFGSKCEACSNRFSVPGGSPSPPRPPTMPIRMELNGCWAVPGD